MSGIGISGSMGIASLACRSRLRHIPRARPRLIHRGCATVLIKQTKLKLDGEGASLAEVPAICRAPHRGGTTPRRHHSPGALWTWL